MSDIWNPPAGSVLVISIEAIDGPYHEDIVPVGGLTVAQFEAAIRQLTGRFELPKNQSFYHITLSDHRLPLLLAAVAESTRRGELRIGSAWIEEPDHDPDDPDAWFVLSSGPRSFKSPSRIWTDGHFASRDNQKLASDRFREIVVSHGLTGLAWLPLVDARRDDPILWHEVYAEQPIGRGLDHPLIDPAKLIAKKWGAGADATRRWGECDAWLEHFWDDYSINDPVVPGLIPSAQKYFRVTGPDRFVREHLPKADFAYQGWGFRPDNGVGHEGRSIRRVCCNARARKILIDAGLMKPTMFKALAIVPAAEARAEILDRTIVAPIPPPIYTQPEAASERERRAKAISERGPTPRAIRYESTEAAVADLKRRIANGTATWIPAQRTREFKRIRSSPHFPLTPLAWQRIAPLLPLEAFGSDDNVSFEFVQQAPEWNTWLAYEPGFAPPDEEPSTEDLIVAKVLCGDWYAFRKNDPLLPHDARLVLWDHETTTIDEDWPSIADFAAHVVNMCNSLESVKPDIQSATSTLAAWVNRFRGFLRP